MFDGEAQEREIKLQCKDYVNDKVNGYYNKTAQIARNLISNAIKFTSEGNVSIDIRPHESNDIKIIITDTGIGISKKDLPNVFNRFYRGTGTEKTLGSGLGLSIAQALVNAHQGKIVVNSKPGNGTSVSVKLPLAKISS